ncbi:MAG: conjugal transfer protein TraX [Oscillospiraceae bacterium]|jgi:hypothetical protein|nr:conjugal transfer protein TraX [Oscillospiraceae bacterium]
METLMLQEESKAMTASKLKFIALITMTLDHIDKIFGQAFWLLIFPGELIATSYLGTLLGWIGRMTFPVYAYFIAEGCSKTKNMPKYIGRLFLFALLSAPFYAFAMHENLSESGLVAHLLNGIQHLEIGNVFLTLAAGASAIYVYQLAERKMGRKAFFIAVPALVVFMLIAESQHSDYGMLGVLLIFVLYLCKSNRSKAITIVLWSFGFYMLYAAWNGSQFAWLNPRFHTAILPVANFLFSSAAAMLLFRYNGKRGKSSKWLFYLYYPAHLFVLGIMCYGFTALLS